MSNFEKNITIEYLRQTAERGRELKDCVHRLLRPEIPSVLLDIGCGPGVDTVALGKMSHPESVIIGLDTDPAMLCAADAAAVQTGVTERVHHVRGSAAALPFADATFDGVSAERVFQVISPDVAVPGRLFSEALRVLKPGGTLVLADTDWATASINYSNLEMERRFVRFFSDVCRPNGYAGRLFPELMNRAGLRDVALFVFPAIIREFNEQFPLADWLVRELRARGAATEEELDTWVTDLSAQSARGEFLFVCNMNVMVGTKP